MWIIWILALAVGAVIAWFLLGIVMAILAPPETSGKLLLKKECQKQGVAIELIPDAAFDEMVASSVKFAKFTAQFGRDTGERNWRSNLVLSLENEAVVVAEVMGGSRADAFGQTRGVLVKFGVIRD